MARADDLEPPPEGGGGRRLSAGVIVGMVLGGALTLFVGQNTQQTTVTWLVFDAEQPLWVVLAVTAAVTLLVAELIGGGRRRRKSKERDGAAD